MKSYPRLEVHIIVSTLQAYGRVNIVLLVVCSLHHIVLE